MKDKNEPSKIKYQAFDQLKKAKISVQNLEQSDIE